MTKAKFSVGDQVTLVGNDKILYIISDIHDYEVYRDDASHQVFDYELIKIYPVVRDVNFMIEGELNLVSYAKFDSKMWNTMISYIKNAFRDKRWVEEPAFIEIVHNNLTYQVGDQKIKLTTANLKSADQIIKYDNFKTVDEGLDALSDLNMLIHVVGDTEDKEYTKAKKAVVKKLKKIVS